MDEVTGKQRWLYNEEVYDLYSSPNIIWVIKSRRMRSVGHVASMGKKRHACKILVGKPRCRWEDNIKLGLHEVGFGGMDWTDLT
jgi:hypothetical protein